jgi:hypothetical protein
MTDLQGEVRTARCFQQRAWKYRDHNDPALGTGMPPGAGDARSRDRTRSLASLIDSSHILAEIMAYTEEKGSYSSQKFPQKPDFPR